MYYTFLLFKITKLYTWDLNHEGKRAHVNVAENSDSSNGVLRARDETTCKRNGATKDPFSVVVLDDDHPARRPIKPEDVKNDTTVSAA